MYLFPEFDAGGVSPRLTSLAAPRFIALLTFYREKVNGQDVYKDGDHHNAATFSRSPPLLWATEEMRLRLMQRLQLPRKACL